MTAPRTEKTVRSIIKRLVDIIAERRADSQEHEHEE